MAGLEPDIRIYKDPETLGHAAAELVAAAAVEAVQDRGRFLLCLSGGSTPEQLFAALALPPFRETVDWSRVHVFWGDERCVPAQDLNSNYRRANDLLLSRVAAPQENIHRMRTELGPELAAEDYTLTLRRYAQGSSAWPRFDLALLGLGTDGHTASLFPGSPQEMSQAVQAVAAPEGTVGPHRVTLTPVVFNAARCVAFLAEGSGKARIVAGVLYGEQDPEKLPAQRIKPHDGRLIWMLDAGAAARG